MILNIEIEIYENKKKPLYLREFFEFFE